MLTNPPLQTSNMVLNSLKTLVAQTRFKPISWMEEEVYSEVREDEALHAEIAAFLEEHETTLDKEWLDSLSSANRSAVVKHQPTEFLRNMAELKYRTAVLTVTIAAMAKSEGDFETRQQMGALSDNEVGPAVEAVVERRQQN